MKKQSLHISVLMLLAMGLCGHALAATNASITISSTGTPVSGSGGITVAFGDSAGHAYSETAPYGQYSSPASIASWLAAKFTTSYLCPAVGNWTGGLGAHASGSVITFQLNNGASFGRPTVTNPSSSFSFNLAAWPPPTPVITWATPAPITFGTALSSMQLNATASVPGVFSYSPSLGTVLSAGSQLLSATFTPTDMVNYTPVTASVVLVVSPVSQWTWNVVAGNGTIGYSGDGGPATSAALYGPKGVAVDGSGNVYFADYDNFRIRKVTLATGIISTVAGTGVYGSSGDGGPATSAEFEVPIGLVFDSSGNLYVSDSGTQRVRKINASTGIITTIAGNGSSGYSGDGGAATNAKLASPWGLAVDSANNIYIADSYNQRIREVNSSTGIISTVAGKGTVGFSGDGGYATSAQLNYPFGVAVDTAGDIYIADTVNERIRKVTKSSGIITTIAGNGTAGYSSGGGPATSAALSEPIDVKLDGAGNIYVSDSCNTMVRMITASTGIISNIGIAIGTEQCQQYGIYINPGANQLYVSSSLQYVVGGTYGPDVLYWPTPAPIAFGTPLSSAQLNAASGVPGTFTYTPPAGTILSPGSHTLSVLFTPTDTVDYHAITSSVNITINTPPTTVSWEQPEPITYGTPLSSAQLDASANVPGTFAYNPPIGTLLHPGSYSLTTTFTPADTTVYSTATATVPLTVNKAEPTITWTTPAPITYGTAISAAQLNAISSVQGTFTYDIQSGTVLDVGSYPLGVTFTPIDTTDYTTSMASVTLQVNFVTAPTTALYSYSIANASGAPGSGYAGNGDILAYTDSVNGTWSNVAYDGLDRLVGAIGTPPSGTTQYACWNYDSFGNRTAQVLQSSSCPSSLTPTMSYNLNNQVSWVQNSAPTGFTYDGAGNVTCDTGLVNGVCNGPHAYLYDAEGRICAEMTQPVPGTYTMTQYIYDATGARVAKGSITNWAAGCDTTQNGFTPTNSYVIGPNAEQLTETNGSGNWLHTNVFAGGELVATVKSDAVHFQLSDWLGTRRVQASYTGAIEEACSSLPFGDQESCSGPGTDATEHHFTSRERDQESGNDYFGARYYASMTGRWLSPDKPFADQHPTNPQSWNLYEYALNTPLVAHDPNGREVRKNEFDAAQAIVSQYAKVHPGGTFYIDFEGIKGTGNGQNPRGFDGAEIDHSAENSYMVSNQHWGRGFVQAFVGLADKDEADTGIAIYKAARDAGLSVGANSHSNGVNALGQLTDFILNSNDPTYSQNLTTVRMVEPNTMNPSTITSIINASDFTRADISCYDPALIVAVGGSMFPAWWRNWTSLDVHDSGDVSHNLEQNMKDTGGAIQPQKQ